MRRIVSCVLALALCAISARGQTPEEIISRMSAELEKYNSNRVAMTIEMTLPIVGKVSSKSYAIGEKVRLDATIKGITVSTWSDGVTVWTYNPESNEVGISSAAAGSGVESNGDMGMFNDITEGYAVTIESQTPDSWYLKCKKTKQNKSKDAPKTMDLVVAKGSYFPKSLGFKVKGIPVTMKDISFNVAESQVIFNMADYPGAKVVDKR